MSTRKSTYREVIDDILLDLGKVSGLDFVKDEMYQNWINRAQSSICNEMQIEEQMEIGLVPDEAIVDVTTLLREPKRIRMIQRNENTFKGVVEEVSKDTLLGYKQRDAEWNSAHTSQDSPAVFAFWTDNERRYIEFYPVPKTSENVTVFYYLGFSPREHQEEDVEKTEIFLPQDYEQLLKLWVEAQVYGYLQNEQMKIQTLNYYEREKKVLNARKGFTSRISMTYS